jgi:tetratricopeptide (TPR) repeat protein
VPATVNGLNRQGFTPHQWRRLEDTMQRFSFVAMTAAVIVVGSFAPVSSAENIGLVCTSENTPADAQIAACSKIIAMKRFSGGQLSSLYFWRAIGYNKKGDYTNVINDATEGLRITPNDQALLNLRGSAYFDKGDYDIAIADLTDALKAGQPSGLIYHNRGNAYRDKKDYAHAIADYDMAIKLSPTAYSYENRGASKQALGDLDGAFADMNQAIRLDPKAPAPLIDRSELWRIKQDYERAIGDANAAIQLLKSGVPLPTLTAPGSFLLNAYVNRGLAYESKGDIDTAKVDYTAALGVTVADANSKKGQALVKAKLAAFSKADALPPQPATNTAGGRRIALVIGNGAYTHVTALPNPPNDAHAVSKTLHDLGFEVTESINADHATLEKVTSNFIVGATGAKIALLYYAGHGVQIDGHNFLVPVDIQRDSAPKLMADMTDMDNLLAGLDDKIRTNILIFDACRNNPFEKVADTGAGRSITISTGLASPGSLASGATAGAGTLIAFATAPGKVALDGEGANSPFSAALSKYMPTPGIEVQQMLTRVRADVVAATDSKQVPWSNSSLLGEVFLAGAK